MTPTKHQQELINYCRKIDEILKTEYNIEHDDESLLKNCNVGDDFLSGDGSSESEHDTPTCGG